jgi:hypothetical protein
MSNNAVSNSGWGYQDESTGSRTAGTANTYKGNTASGNTLGVSSPAGL